MQSLVGRDACLDERKDRVCTDRPSGPHNDKGRGPLAALFVSDANDGCIDEVEGLLERLLYLSYGLAAILGFIGVKLVLHALHENNVPFINDGEPVNVIGISPLHSLVVIVVILVATVLLSLLSPKGKAKTVVSRLRRSLAAWQEQNAAGAPWAQRTAAYAQLADAEEAVRALPEQYRALINERQTLREMLAEAHARQASEASG